MSNDTQSPYDEMLKLAESSLRDAVARLGNTHPEVLKMLLQYIAILRQCGKNDMADRLQVKADLLKETLARQEAEQKAQAEEAKAKAQAEAESRAKAEAEARARESAKSPEEEKKADLAKKAAQAKAAAEEGVFDLDMFEDEDEESMAMALELVKETPELASSRAENYGTERDTAAANSEEEIFLYDSKGQHVAVACKGALYSPAGENLGRLLEDYDVFLDRSGWYLGQILDGNRLARDPTWIHRHLNFGDRGNEGNRAGWGRAPDIEKTFFDYGFEDVEFSDD